MAKDLKKSGKGKAKDAKGAKSAKGKDVKGKDKAAAKAPKPLKAKDVAKAGKKAKAKKAAEVEVVQASELAPAVLDFTQALQVGSGFVLADLSPSATPGFDGDKEAGEAALAAMVDELGELQERLYAESRGGGNRRLLLVVQGMDTSGKGGIMRHVVGAMDPQGVDLTSFKAPTAEERAHPFLWRIRNALPRPGQVGVFDRSHYEDVLIARVRNLVPRTQWARRYGQINTFERQVSAQGTTIVKVMMHVSKDEQKVRLQERLDRPDKHWKYNPGDIDERLLWDDYQAAYQVALTRCSTPDAPWYVVPADRKWYARLAVMGLVLEHLRMMDPQWPTADFDVEAEKERLAQS